MSANISKDDGKYYDNEVKDRIDARNETNKMTIINSSLKSRLCNNSIAQRGINRILWNKRRILQDRIQDD